MNWTEWAKAEERRLLPEFTECVVEVVTVTENFWGDPNSIQLRIVVIGHPEVRDFPMWLQLPRTMPGGVKARQYYDDARKISAELRRKITEFIRGFGLDGNSEFDPRDFKGKRAKVILGYHTTKRGDIIHRIFHFVERA